MALTKKENDKLYYIRHKKDIRGKQKLYYVKYRNTEARRNSWHIFNGTPKGIYQVMKSNSKKKNRSFNLLQKDFLDWYNQIEKKCFYCSIPQDIYVKNNLFFRPLRTRRHAPRLTIDRRDNNLPYQISNIVLCCSRCNFIKSNFFSEKEMLDIGKKYIEPKWKK